MTRNNKKGRPKTSEQEKAKVVHVPSFPIEDDKVLNLQTLNANLVKLIDGLRKENAVLTTNVTEMQSEIGAARRKTEEWKEAEKEFRKELGRKDEEHEAAISQACEKIKKAEERFNSKMSAKEDECKALTLDKMNLEVTVLQLQNQIEARSAELEESDKGWKLEKDVLLSQIAAAEKETSEITRSRQMAHEAFNAEKENLLSRLAELETNLELAVNEKRSLGERNREISTEAESLKAHLNEYSEKLVRVEDEKQSLEAVSGSIAEGLEDLIEQNATMEKEHARKYGEYQAAISHAAKQLLEAQERFDTEISAKEDECKAMNLDKKSLEATVLRLKNKIEARSAELEASNKGRKLEKDILLSQIVAAKRETAEISRNRQMAEEALNAEKESLLSRLAELQTSLVLMANEKETLSQTNRELKNEGEYFKAHMNEYSEKLLRMEDEKQALEAVSVSIEERLEDLIEQNATMEKEHERKYGEYQAAISQAIEQLLEAEERFNSQISAKEDECKAVNIDKNNMEATVLKLTNEIQARSAELEANSKGWKLEKDTFLSQIGEAKKETVHVTRSSQMAQEVFNTEKENLLSRLAELQTNLELMANERGSLRQTNRELKTEGESLKAQLKVRSEKLVSLEDEKQALEAASVSQGDRLEALLKQKATMEKEINSLQKQVDENVKKHSDVIQQYKVEENSLKQQNEMLAEKLRHVRFLLYIRDESNHEIQVENDKEILSLRKQVDENVKQHSHVIQQYEAEGNSLKQEVLSIRSLLETRDKSIHERIVENGKLSNQVEELSNTIVELHEANAIVVQEKDDLKRKFESLLAEYVNDYKVMEEKQSEFLKEKEEQERTIKSLRGEIKSLMDEKSSVSRDLNEANKKHQDFLEKRVQSQHPTIPQEKRTVLVDTVNHMDVNENKKPSAVNERQGKQEKRNRNGRNQSKAPQKPQRKGK